MRRKEVRDISILIIAFAAVLTSLLLRSVINMAQAIELVVLFAIVLVTGMYVKRTVEMAKEMKEQRYDSVRPVIDIKRREINRTEEDLMLQTREAYAAIDGDISHGLECELHNVGLGPAIDVYSFVQPPNRERKRWDFGTIAKGKNTEAMSLSLEHPNDWVGLVIYYKDIYGRAYTAGPLSRVER